MVLGCGALTGRLDATGSDKVRLVNDDESKEMNI